MQLAAVQPLLVWHGAALAQVAGDAGEGASPCAAPAANTVGAVDSPAARDDGGIDGGDSEDGAAAPPDPAGTDTSGTEQPDSPDVVASDSSGAGASATANIGYSSFAGANVYNSFSAQGLWGGGSPKINKMKLAGDPIDLSLADKRHQQIDYVSVGDASVRMARVYHSNPAANAARVTVPMGVGWHMFYDRSVQVLGGSQVRLHRANGQLLDFVFNGSAWVSSMPAGVLTQAGGGWQYVNHRDAIETYDANGRLLSLSDAGLVTALQYDTNGRLSRVANPFGRALSFSYDGAGRIGTVTLADGNTLGYGYDTRNNLVSIRFADNAVRQYVYENASFPNALTGVVDESGRRGNESPRLTAALPTCTPPSSDASSR